MPMNISDRPTGTIRRRFLTFAVILLFIVSASRMSCRLLRDTEAAGTIPTHDAPEVGGSIPIRRDARQTTEASAVAEIGAITDVGRRNGCRLTIVDESGKPLSDALAFTLQETIGKRVLESSNCFQRTKSDGLIVLGSEMISSTMGNGIVVAKEGYCSKSISGDQLAESDVMVTLDRGMQLSVCVQDLEGKAVEGARVALSRERFSFDPMVNVDTPSAGWLVAGCDPKTAIWFGRTDHNGIASFSGLSGGAIGIGIDHLDYWVTDERALIVDPAANVAVHIQCVALLGVAIQVKNDKMIKCHADGATVPKDLKYPPGLSLREVLVRQSIKCDFVMIAPRRSLSDISLIKLIIEGERYAPEEFMCTPIRLSELKNAQDVVLGKLRDEPIEFAPITVEIVENDGQVRPGLVGFLEEKSNSPRARMIEMRTGRETRVPMGTWRVRIDPVIDKHISRDFDIVVASPEKRSIRVDLKCNLGSFKLARRIQQPIDVAYLNRIRIRSLDGLSMTKFIKFGNVSPEFVLPTGRYEVFQFSKDAWSLVATVDVDPEDAEDVATTHFVLDE